MSFGFIQCRFIGKKETSKRKKGNIKKEGRKRKKDKEGQ